MLIPWIEIVKKDQAPFNIRTGVQVNYAWFIITDLVDTWKYLERDFYDIATFRGTGTLLSGYYGKHDLFEVVESMPCWYYNYDEHKIYRHESDIIVDNCNFMQRTRMGERLDVDDFVDSWHDWAAKETGLSLHEYLGMTEEEYSVWLRYPSKLEELINDQQRAN